MHDVPVNAGVEILRLKLVVKLYDSEGLSSESLYEQRKESHTIEIDLSSLIVGTEANIPLISKDIKVKKDSNINILYKQTTLLNQVGI